MTVTDFVEAGSTAANPFSLAAELLDDSRDQEFRIFLFVLFDRRNPQTLISSREVGPDRDRPIGKLFPPTGDRLLVPSFDIGEIPIGSCGQIGSG